MTETKRRGGPRPGAGRPRKNNGVLYLRMNPDAADRIRTAAAGVGITPGEYVTRLFNEKEKASQ